MFSGRYFGTIHRCTASFTILSANLKDIQSILYCMPAKMRLPEGETPLYLSRDQKELRKNTEVVDGMHVSSTVQAFCHRHMWGKDICDPKVTWLFEAFH